MKRARAAIIDFLRADGETLLAFFFSRLLICALAWFAFRSVRHAELPLTMEGSASWNMLFRWDADWYRSIVEHGYELQEGQSNVNFFPLYPLSVRFVCWITKASTAPVGFFLSNTFFLAAVVLLRRLVALDFPEPSKVPARAVWLVLLYPVTFFYSAVYTESLYLLLSLGAFLAARKGRWALACIAGALLSATRSVGVIILLPLVWEAIVERRRSPEGAHRGLLRSHWWLLIVPSGLAIFCAFLGIRFGDPLAFTHSMDAWGRAFTAPWNGIASALTMYPAPYVRLFLGTEALALIVLFFAFRLRLRTSYLIYTAVLLLVFISMTVLEALPRYVSSLFPLQIALAVFSVRFRESFYFAVLAASTALMILCLVLFTGGYWMT